MNKKIGIVGWNLGDNSFGATKPYLEYFAKYGDVLILGPDTYMPEINLLVLPGGKDVVHGNSRISFWNGAPDQFLEHFDNYTLPKYFGNTPIFGICRGMQTLMRHTGVPLVQDIDWIHGYSKDENDDKVNTLMYHPDFQYLQKRHGVSKIGSWHHQCVLRHDLTPEWQAMAWVRDDKHTLQRDVVEYVRHREYPIYATQSHPERNDNFLDEALITELLGL